MNSYLRNSFQESCHAREYGHPEMTQDEKEPEFNMNNQMKRGQSMRKLFVVFVIGLLFPSGVAGAADNGIIKKGDLLTVDRCVNIALKTHPIIISSRSSFDAGRSRIGQAESSYYPQLSLSSGYSRNYSGATTAGSTYNQYTNSATVSQNIYDFGKTPAQVKVQELNSDAAKSDLENLSQQITLNVRQAYYGLLQAMKNRAVAEDNVKQFEHHLEQAKGFFSVGTKPKFDVTKAEVDLSNARLGLIKAQNAIKTATAALNNAMGLLDAPEYVIEDDLSFKKYEVTFESALNKALESRSDIKAAAAKRLSAEKALELAGKGYYPYLSGNAAYTRSSEKLPLKEGWNAGVTLTVPIFSGFLTKHQVDEAVANHKAAKANEDLVKQNVFLEVQQAFINLKEAEERIPTAELAVKQAIENLDIANGRYSAGVGSPIEVTDAQALHTNAKTAYIQALSDYKVARAAIDKAMGGS